MHPIDHIRKFANITPKIEDNLRKVVQEHHPHKGEMIQGANNLITYAYYLASGSARVYYIERGKEHTVAFAFDNQFVIVPRHLVKSYPDTVAIQFLEPSEVVFIPHLRIKSILEESDAVADTEGLLFLSAALIDYNLFLEERVEVMQSLSAEERYKWALRRYPRIEDCATTTQLASFLGVTKETLYRIKGGKYTIPGKAWQKQHKKEGV